MPVGKRRRGRIVAPVTVCVVYNFASIENSMFVPVVSSQSLKLRLALQCSGGVLVSMYKSSCERTFKLRESRFNGIESSTR